MCIPGRIGIAMELARCWRSCPRVGRCVLQATVAGSYVARASSNASAKSPVIRRSLPWRSHSAAHSPLILLCVPLTGPVRPSAHLHGQCGLPDVGNNLYNSGCHMGGIRWRVYNDGVSSS